MGVPGSANPLLLRSAGVTQYQVSRSLRFNSADSAYLSRTPASAGNRTTWTFSCWLKRSKLGAQQSIFIAGETYAAGSGDTWATGAMFGADDKLNIYWRSSNSPLAITAAVYRDCSAWYHIVLTANSTTLKAYVNGSEVASGSISGNGAVNSTLIHLIGVAGTTTYFAYANQMLAECHFIDGQALDPTSFTEVSATTGQLVPKAYSGSFGTNGFWLKFSDNSAATATTLGKDSAGSNNWTPNNFSVTAGAGNDSLVDTPTSYGTGNSGGDVRGNFCTWNPLNIAGGALANGNLDLTNTGGGRKVGTVAVSSGKWYWEVAVTSAGDAMIGIMPPSNPPSTASGNFLGGAANEYGYYATNGQKYNNSSATAYGATFANGDVIGVALDMDAGTLVFYKNGTSQGTAFSGLSGTFAPGASAGGSSGASMTLNAGQRPFAYAAPSGFKALCDTNLPAPVVAKPNTVFDVKTYSANNGTQAITGLNFSPDLVWTKSRSNAYIHNLYDTVRGATKYLKSNSTEAEGTNANTLISFDSAGFTLGQLDDSNYLSGSSVAWTWDAGTSTVTNTQGSISSQVRANASAGFSIITYTGNGSGGATFGHGLGVAPEFVIFKTRGVADDWRVYHKQLDASAPANYYLMLQSTNAKSANQGTSFMNSTAPSSTLITLGSDSAINGNGRTMVCYAFSPVAGYSSFGSFDIASSSDNFIYTGFRPRFLLYRYSNTTGNWAIFDTARNTYNVADYYLFANSSGAEGTSANWDFLSNGFKLRNSLPVGNTVIFAAFAESPFQYARAR